MIRFNYEYITPTSLEEHKTFTPELPYMIHIKHFPVEDVVPLHYANSIEILVADSVKGAVFIEDRWYPLDNEHIFFIPPNTIHTTKISAGCGKLYVLKVNIEMLANYFDITKILKYSNNSIFQVRFCQSNYAQADSIIQQLLVYDADFFRCMVLLMSLFEMLCKNIENRKTSDISQSKNRGLDLHKLINWTQENMQRKISLDEVSRHFGYSKFYFCSQFKAQTGTTFNEYLTTVRLSRAYKMLLDNKTVKETCYSCGFDNVPYFIQLYKRYYGESPKAYIKRVNAQFNSLPLNQGATDNSYTKMKGENIE